MTLSREAEQQKTPFFTQFKRRGVELICKPFGLKPFENVETLIKLSAEQFDSAQHSIQIVEERFSSHIYNNPLIIRSLKDAINSNVKIQLICGPEFDPKNIELIKLIRAQRIDLFQLDKNPPFHFDVVDRTSIKQEDYHGDAENYRKGYFIPRAKFIGNTYVSKFNNLLAFAQQQSV